GTYKIMNTSTGGCKDSSYITVNQLPVVTPLTNLCAGESASLALNAAFAASGGISVWSIDSSPTGVGDAPVLSEVSPGDTSFVTTATSKAGTYKIMNTSAGGCKDSTYIIVNQAPVVAPLTNICLGENASLVLSATVGVSVWSIDSIPTGTGGFPTIEEVSPGDTSFISTSTSRPGTYKIINTSLPGGCKDSVYITVNSLPVITPLTNVCAGETANLTINAAFIADGGVSVWSIDSTPTGTGSIPTIVEVSPGDTSFISTATSRAGTYKILNTSIPGGCKDSVYITVNPVPVVTQLTNICAGESAGLSVDATFIAAGGVSVWSIDSVPTGTGDVPTIAEVSPGDTSFITTITSKAGTYKILNVSVPGGCKDSTYIIVNPKKDATITTTTGNDTLTLCEKDPDDPQVTVAETGGTWNNINVTMPFGSTTATIDLSAIKPVTDLMLIYKFDAPEPCPDADTIWITTTSILDASILAMMDYCISDTTSYVLTKSATANDGGTWWVNGVENPAKIFKPSLLPAGTYSIEQRIGGLCGDTDTVSVMIYPLAVADITGDATLCRYDDAITLSADSTSITWKEIDGKVGFNTGTLVFNPLTAASGVHQIEHTVSNAQCSDVDTAWVTVIDTAVIAIGSFGPYCANGSAVVITATDTSTPDTSGAWIPSAYLTAGGSFDPTLANVGKNAVKYTVGIACPVTEIDSIEVLLNENANIPAYPGLCSQDPAISVIGTSGELLSTTVGVYTPVTGYDVTSNMFDPVVAGVGTHKILYTLGDLQMCGDSASTTIKVTAAAIITPTNPVDRCVGDITTPSTFLASVGTATGTGVWSLNAPALGSINPNTGVWSGTGVTAGGKVYATYTFTTTDPAPNGCVSSALDSLEVFDNPVIDFSRENEDSCVAYADVFTDNTVYSLAALSGSTWDFGNGATGTNQGSDGTNYTVAGEYTVTLSNEYANGCEATADTVINVFPLPTADFVWSPNPVSVLDPRIQFTNSGDLTDEFLWDFTSKGSPVTSASIMPSTVFSVLGDDTIPVTLIVTNNFMASTGATVGCTDTVIKNVIIQDIFQLYVPNAFTPGTKSDGLNDTFYPKGRNWALDNYEFLVLDRWGNLIFQTTTIGHGWDGTVDGSASSGRLSQNDVYVWKLTVKNMYTGKVYRKVGTVTLVK
ncbi:MAG: gliding motility-associated-like protein, partial [Glaciecola sp.]